MWGEVSMEKFVTGEENFHEGGFSSIKKKIMKKISMENFSTESKEQH